MSTREGGRDQERRNRRQRAREQISEQVDFDVEEEDIEETEEGGFRLTEQVQRERAAQQLNQQFPGVRVSPEDVVPSGDGFTVSERVQKQRAAQQFDPQVPGVDIRPGDIRREDGQFALEEGIIGRARPGAEVEEARETADVRDEERIRTFAFERIEPQEAEVEQGPTRIQAPAAETSPELATDPQAERARQFGEREAVEETGITPGAAAEPEAQPEPAREPAVEVDESGRIQLGGTREAEREVGISPETPDVSEIETPDLGQEPALSVTEQGRVGLEATRREEREAGISSDTPDVSDIETPDLDGRQEPVTPGGRGIVRRRDQEGATLGEQAQQFEETGSEIGEFALEAGFEGGEGDDIGITGPEIGIRTTPELVRGLSEGEFKSPITVTRGEPGEVEPGVISSLFGEGGFRTQAEEQEILEQAQERQEQFSISEEAGLVAAGLGLPEEGQQFFRGAGQFPGEIAALPQTAEFGAETAVEFGENIPGTVEQFGAETTAETLLESSARIGAGIVEEAREEPFRFAGEVGAEVALGFGAGRAIERGADIARGRVRAQRADQVVDIEDVTTQEAAETGELPEFETAPGSPTREAVEEVRERAADQPESLQEEFDVGEGQFLFRSEEQALPSDFEAERGQFELPGLFASPDLSPLRLQEGAEGGGLPSVRLGLPRVRGTGEQVTLFPGERIEGMPESATGSGFAFTPEGERIPDPETTGAQFLEEEAEPGTAFVRPPGSRTTELEAIFPPGSEFEEVGEFAVRTQQGRIIPGAGFRRARRQRRREGREGREGELEEEELLGLTPASRLPETRIRRDQPTTVTPTITPTTSPFRTPTRPPTDVTQPTEVTPTERVEEPGITEPFGGAETFSEPTQPSEPSGVTETGIGPGTEQIPSVGDPTEQIIPGTQQPTTPPTERAPPTQPPGISTPFGTTEPGGRQPTSIPGTGEPSAPFLPPTIPGTEGTPPFDRPDIEGDEREFEEEEEFAPLGATFQNPLLTAREALENPFAGFGGF